MLHVVRDWPAAIRIALAILCLLVGLTGVILPILPGWPFLFVGLAILATVFPGIERFWRARLRRCPTLRKAIRKVRPKPETKRT
jgi:uncharacterized membrane protein YbaN (DUF454 family)